MFLSEKIYSSHTIVERIGISQSAVIAAEQIRNSTTKSQIRDHKQLLMNLDTRIISEMRKKLPSKRVSLAINKKVREWATGT